MKTKKSMWFALVIIMMIGVALLHADTPITDPSDNQPPAKSDQQKITTEPKNVGDKVNENLKPEDVQVKSNVDDKTVDMTKNADKTTLTSDTDFTLKTKKSEEQKNFATDDKTQTHNEYKGFEQTSDGKKPTIELDNKGQVSGANFKVGDIPDGEKTKEGMREYVFGDYKIQLPKGSEFSLKDNKADIKMPENSKLIPPEKIKEKSTDEKDITFNYKLEKGEMELPNGNKMSEPTTKTDKEGKKQESVIKYENGQAFVDFTDNTKINDVDIKGLSAQDMNRDQLKDAFKLSGEDKNLRTHINFDEKTQTGNNINFVDKDGTKSLSLTTEKNSFHSLQLQKDNPYVKIEDNNHLRITPQENSKITITNDGKTKPTIDVYGHNAQIEVGDKRINFAMAQTGSSTGENYREPAGIYMSRIAGSQKEAPGVDIRAFDQQGKPLFSSVPSEFKETGRVEFDRIMSFGKDGAFIMPARSLSSINTDQILQQQGTMDQRIKDAQSKHDVLAATVPVNEFQKHKRELEIRQLKNEVDQINLEQTIAIQLNSEKSKSLLKQSYEALLYLENNPEKRKEYPATVEYTGSKREDYQTRLNEVNAELSKVIEDKNDMLTNLVQKRQEKEILNSFNNEINYLASLEKSGSFAQLSSDDKLRVFNELASKFYPDQKAYAQQFNGIINTQPIVEKITQNIATLNDDRQFWTNEQKHAVYERSQAAHWYDAFVDNKQIKSADAKIKEADNNLRIINDQIKITERSQQYAEKKVKNLGFESIQDYNANKDKILSSILDNMVSDKIFKEMERASPILINHPNK